MSGSTSNYGSQPATDETRELIASDKVQGTAVYNMSGDKLGSVYNFMVNKRSGKVAYVVMSFGGFLGMGTNYHPLPWDQLTYDADRGGYIINLTRDQLEGAPAYSASEADLWNDPAYDRKIDDYYAPLGGRA